MQQSPENPGKLAKAATSPTLKQELTEHLKQTEGQVKRQQSTYS